jgi:AsmA protein
MKKPFKYALFGLGGLVLVLAIIVAVVAATFNPNDYKPLVVKLVQDKKQRTLHIDGDIKLAFWPKIGADLGKISLSEHNGLAALAQETIGGRYRLCRWRTCQHRALQGRHYQL